MIDLIGFDAGEMTYNGIVYKFKTPDFDDETFEIVIFNDGTNFVMADQIRYEYIVEAWEIIKDFNKMRWTVSDNTTNEYF